MTTGSTPKPRNYKGKKVAIIGLGIEGQDLARFFAREGAIVTVSDAKPAERLERQLAAIADLDLTLCLGGNPAEMVDGADLLAITQGAPLDLPPMLRARELGIPLTSRTRLFFELCPGPIVGISGSSGKTTTTSLVGAIFAAARRRSLVGGNIGGPLLSRLDELDPETWVILEISHTQLQLTDRSPYVACLTNVTPNHLDQFTWHDYVELKGNLLAYQTASDLAVLNYDDEVTRSMAESCTARVLHFSLQNSIPGDGAFLRGDRIIMRSGGAESDVIGAAEVPLRGRHNLANALCAAAVASACAIGPDTVREAITTFPPVPHRLELVSVIDGISYYNDSIATAPERTIAGMRSFDEPLVLLLGGREKRLPLDELGSEAAARCRAVICFGEAGAVLARACTNAHRRGICSPFIRRVATLPEALTLATGVARRGDVVLLSPACTSFDAYDNFEQRGEQFRALVQTAAASGSGLLNGSVEAESSQRA